MPGDRTVAPIPKRWRVGKKLGRTIYFDGECVGMVDSDIIAERLVKAANADNDSRCVMTAETVIVPFDNKSALRPHTIPNYWQVWSGGICIALLGPDDVPDALRGTWRKP